VILYTVLVRNDAQTLVSLYDGMLYDVSLVSVHTQNSIVWLSRNGIVTAGKNGQDGKLLAGKSCHLAGNLTMAKEIEMLPIKLIKIIMIASYKYYLFTRNFV